MQKARDIVGQIQRKQILIVILVGISCVALASVLISLFKSELEFDCGTDNKTTVEVVQDIKNRLTTVGLKETPFMSSTGINNHIQRLCNDEITVDVLYKYADQLDYLNEIGHQYGQPVPATVWDVQTREMQDNNDNEYQIVDTLVDSQPEYAQLLIRAYNRLYAFKQNQSTDTALDTSLDLLLNTIGYYDQITNEDFDSLDEAAGYDIGKEIVRTWQQMIGHTARTNPLTGKPILPYSSFSHLSVTNMWRHQTRQNVVIGRIWGVSGFDTRFVGDSKNINQIEHLAISITLQYADNTSLFVLNAYEIQDTLSGGQTSVMATADQTINNVVSTEFIPYFTNHYSLAIDHLRCILSSSNLDQRNSCQTFDGGT